MIKTTDVLGQLIYRNEESSQAITVEELAQFLSRSEFDRALEQEWEKGLQETRPLSIILAQVDAQKGDSFIYSIMADQYIQQIAEAIRSVVYRSPDLIYRCGGEEFGIILPHTSVESAVHVATQIQRSLGDLFRDYNSVSANKPITLSYGLSGIRPSKEVMPTQLLEAAEIALRQSKNKGRNSISVHLVEDVSSLLNTASL